jgi:hypothetical protein
MRNVCILFGRPEGKRTLGRPRRRWEDNIKVDFKWGRREGSYDYDDEPLLFMNGEECLE